MRQNTRNKAKALAKNAKQTGQERPPTPSPLMNPRTARHALLLSAIIGLTFVAYSNSWNSPLFVVDNAELLLEDTRIQSVTSDHIHRILAQPYRETTLTPLYRPLTTFSYMLNYSMLGNGTNPSGYHWLNFILHAIAIGLVYALGLAIFEQIPAAFLLAALWGVHPVLTESVTNVVGRADILAAVGVLAALLSHRKALRSSGLRKALWVALIALAVTAGIFSKENAIVVVAVVALYDFAFERAASWRSRLPGYLAVSLPCLVFLCVRGWVLAGVPHIPPPFVDNPLVGTGFWTARMTAVKVIGCLLRLMVWPAHLSWDYSYNAIPLFGWGLGTWEDWKAILALIACGAAVGVAVRSWRRNKPLFFAIAFFFATLSPTSNLVILIGSIMAERFLYLPSVGFVAAAVCAFHAAWRRLPEGRSAYRYVAGTALSVILIGFSVRTYDRNRDWSDQQRLSRNSLEAVPGSYRAHISAAYYRPIVTPQDWTRSLDDISRALAILDGLPDLQNASHAYLYAGSVYRTIGERLANNQASGPASEGTTPAYWYRKSLDALLRAVRIDTTGDDQDRRENAKRGKPGLTLLSSSLYLELGRTYMRTADLRHAVESFERGRRLESDPTLLEEAAAAYRAAGDLHNAAIALVEAEAMDPSRSQLNAQLVQLYGALDPGGCAVTRQGDESSLNLECPLVHGDICTASRNVAANYTRRGQHTEAASILRIATHDLGCTGM